MADDVVVTPIFKMLLLGVFGLILISLGVVVGMSFISEPNPQQIKASEIRTMAFQTLIGALVGLLGGKVT